MRIFLTGPTGFVGSAILTELINGGHDVLGLVRSEKAAEKLRAAGVDVHRGDLEDLNSLQSGAQSCDAVIHTGFVHDFTRFKEVCEIDRHAIKAIGEAISGSDRPFIITSGTALIQKEGIAKESDKPVSGANPRLATEEAADAAAANGAKVAVVRLPPSVHGEGDHGFVPMLIKIAKEKGVSAYVSEGLNRWPAVHRFDAATLFRLVVESNFVSGDRFHAVGEEGIFFKDIATAIGHNLNISVESRTPEESVKHFGWFAHFAAINNPASGIKTQEIQKWKPINPRLLEDLNSQFYYSQSY